MAVIPKDQIEQAFRAAVIKKRQAREDYKHAAEAERQAMEEVAALQILARNFYGLALAEPTADEEIKERAEAVEQSGAATEKISIADRIVAHFKRHPEPATPTEVSEAIKKDTGIEIAAPTITSTRSRNLDIFEMVNEPKRGSFRLKKDAQPTMFTAEQVGRA